MLNSCTSPLLNNRQFMYFVFYQGYFNILIPSSRIDTADTQLLTGIYFFFTQIKKMQSFRLVFETLVLPLSAKQLSVMLQVHPLLNLSETGSFN